jgi:hypothetical protein
MHAHQCAVGEFQLWLEAQLLHPTPLPNIGRVSMGPTKNFP